MANNKKSDIEKKIWKKGQTFIEAIEEHKSKHEFN